jgi:hypothetical protein
VTCRRQVTSRATNLVTTEPQSHAVSKISRNFSGHGVTNLSYRTLSAKENKVSTCPRRSSRPMRELYSFEEGMQLLPSGTQPRCAAISHPWRQRLKSGTPINASGIFPATSSIFVRRQSGGISSTLPSCFFCRFKPWLRLPWRI